MQTSCISCSTRRNRNKWNSVTDLQRLSSPSVVSFFLPIPFHCSTPLYSMAPFFTIIGADPVSSLYLHRRDDSATEKNMFTRWLRRLVVGRARGVPFAVSFTGRFVREQFAWYWTMAYVYCVCIWVRLQNGRKFTTGVLTDVTERWLYFLQKDGMLIPSPFVQHFRKLWRLVYIKLFASRRSNKMVFVNEKRPIFN